jgi:hypothetical protein
MTVILTFADEGGKTRYTARALHWTSADRKTHKNMGFRKAGANVPISLQLSSRNSDPPPDASPMPQKIGSKREARTGTLMVLLLLCLQTRRGVEEPFRR